MKKLSPILSIITIVVLILAIGAAVLIFAGGRMNSTQGTGNPTQGLSTDPTQGTTTDPTQTTGAPEPLTSEELYLASLKESGFRTEGSVLVYSGYSLASWNLDKEVRVAVSFGSKDQLTLVAHSRETEDGWGAVCPDTVDEQVFNNMVRDGCSWTYWSWSRTAKTPGGDEEAHVLNCGTDALKDITIPEELIPEGVTVDIFQDGSNYYIHLYTASPGSLDIAKWEVGDIYNYLVDSGIIVGGEKDE